jgi:anti-anti-sigma factor
MAELGNGTLRFELFEEPDRTLVLELEGELDMQTTPGLEADVEARLEATSRLVVEARGLEFADSSAIALLVRWANRIPAVEIRHPPELLRRVIARMGLSERLQVRP